VGAEPACPVCADGIITIVEPGSVPVRYVVEPCICRRGHQRAVEEIRRLQSALIDKLAVDSGHREREVMEEPLKSCPFCGGPGEFVPDRHDPTEPEHFHVMCRRCEIYAPGDGTYADRVAAWNRRAPASDVPEEVRAAYERGQSDVAAWLDDCAAVAERNGDACSGRLEDMAVAIRAGEARREVKGGSHG